MTKSDIIETGEQKLKTRRNSFLKFVGIAMLIAAAVGVVSGYTVELSREGLVPAIVIIGLLSIAFAAFIWFTVVFYRRIDEVDLNDNLWANTFGFYFFVLAFPAWIVLQDLGVLGEPNTWAIWIGSLGLSFAIYGIRKLGSR